MYIRYRSPANKLASSPPAPPRISKIAFLASSGSLGISITRISSSNSSFLGSSSSRSILAISLNSSSFSVASISLLVSILLTTFLYSSAFSTTFVNSLYSLLSAAKRFISLIASGLDNCCSTSCQRCLMASSLSIITINPSGLI
ncbi:hypothetical protein D3C78_1248700 [compost metagenome]